MCFRYAIIQNATTQISAAQGIRQLKRVIGKMNISRAENVLSQCKEQAKGADFESLSLILTVAFRESPEIQTYVSSRMPALILEHYLRNTLSLKENTIEEWFMENVTWQNNVRNSATHASELSRLVSVAVNELSMRK